MSKRGTEKGPIYCGKCKKKITDDDEYVENPITHEIYCFSCVGKEFDELLEEYPTAIAD